MPRKCRHLYVVPGRGFYADGLKEKIVSSAEEVRFCQMWQWYHGSWFLLGVFILGGWDIPSTSRYSMRMLGFGGIPVYTPICQQSHCWTVRRFFRDSFMLSSSLQVSCCTQVLMLFAEAEKRRRVAHTRYNEVETWKCEAFASQEAFARAESQSLRQWFCFFILCNVLNPIINHPQCHYK